MFTYVFVYLAISPSLYLHLSLSLSSSINPMCLYWGTKIDPDPDSWQSFGKLALHRVVWSSHGKMLQWEPTTSTTATTSTTHHWTSTTHRGSQTAHGYNSNTLRSTPTYGGKYLSLLEDAQMRGARFEDGPHPRMRMVFFRFRSCLMCSSRASATSGSGKTRGGLTAWRFDSWLWILRCGRAKTVHAIHLRDWERFIGMFFDIVKVGCP